MPLRPTGHPDDPLFNHRLGLDSLNISKNLIETLSQLTLTEVDDADRRGEPVQDEKG